MGTAELGSRGERLAEQHLVSLGMRILARRFSTPVGELDLVARDGEVLVFVEVKARRDERYADAEDAITAEKQARLTRAARWYLGRQRCENRPCRFDVLLVIGDAADASPKLRHIRDFFVPEA
jgi:putative endonuclease